MRSVLSSGRISVIIPVYNSEKYLEASVRSVMGQTYRNLEIICINDGSTDGSSEILDRLAAEDERIVVVNKPNGGMGDARNSGLEIAASEWITFVDSDDTIREDTYELAAASFGLRPDMVYFGAEVIDETDSGKSDLIAVEQAYCDVGYCGLQPVEGGLIKDMNVFIWNKLFRRSVLDRYGIHFENIYYEDFPFVMQYVFSVNTVYCIRDRLYRYVRRNGSIMSETRRLTPRSIDHMRAVDSLCAFVARHRNRWHFRYYRVLGSLFTDYYAAAQKYTTADMSGAITDYATSIYRKYGFVRRHVIRCVEGGKVYFVLGPETGLLTRVLQTLFSVRNEFLDDGLYKVVRIFGIPVYRRFKSA